MCWNACKGGKEEGNAHHLKYNIAQFPVGDLSYISQSLETDIERVEVLQKDGTWSENERTERRDVNCRVLLSCSQRQK